MALQNLTPVDINDDYRRWLEQLAVARRGSRVGTAGLIDEASRERAAAATRTGTPLSLARPLTPSGYTVDFTYTDGARNNDIGMGADTVTFDCHGLDNTHLDALNHIAIGDTWHGGWHVRDPDAPSVADLAEHGLFTRGVLVDIPSVRATPWVDPGSPVQADDIERALATTGTRFEVGDALLLYMGRDRFEAAGNTYTGMSGEATMPGVGRSAAEWIIDNGVSILCWDFLDSNHPDEPSACVHLLIWAAGLVLVDNCDLAAAATHQRGRGVADGALVVAPVAVPGSTGALVHPFLLT